MILDKVLDCRAVYKWYGERNILNNITFHVAPGEKLAICGMSGSGKSTLLRCISCLETWDRGEVIVNGTKVLCNKKSMRNIRGMIGIVFQDCTLFPHLNVIGNCTLALTKVKKMNKQEAYSHAMQYLTMLGVSDLRQYSVYELSGGQRQRVAIARSMCMEPDIIMMDEPTSALDPETCNAVLYAINNVVDKYGMTVICVSHNMDFVYNFADRVLYINEGELIDMPPH